LLADLWCNTSALVAGHVLRIVGCAPAIGAGACAPRPWQGTSAIARGGNSYSSSCSRLLFPQSNGMSIASRSSTSIATSASGSTPTSLCPRTGALVALLPLRVPAPSPTIATWEAKPDAAARGPEFEQTGQNCRSAVHWTEFWALPDRLDRQSFVKNINLSNNCDCCVLNHAFFLARSAVVRSLVKHK
jgi:hypothetical protein